MSETKDRPTQKKLTLSGGDQALVTQITWVGWRKVKERMLETLSASEVHRALLSLFQMYQQTDREGDPEAKTVQELLGSSDLVQLAPPALQLLNRALDEMTADLIEECMQGAQPERLTAGDVMELRTAIFQVNNFAGLLDAEKNSLTALVRDFTGAANTKTASPSTGT